MKSNPVDVPRAVRLSKAAVTRRPGWAALLAPAGPIIVARNAAPLKRVERDLVEV